MTLFQMFLAGKASPVLMQRWKANNGGEINGGDVSGAVKSKQRGRQFWIASIFALAATSVIWRTYPRDLNKDPVMGIFVITWMVLSIAAAWQTVVVYWLGRGCADRRFKRDCLRLNKHLVQAGFYSNEELEGMARAQMIECALCLLQAEHFKGKGSDDYLLYLNAMKEAKECFKPFNIGQEKWEVYFEDARKQFHPEFNPSQVV